MPAALCPKRRALFVAATALLVLSVVTAAAADPELHCSGTTWDAYGNFLDVFTFKNTSNHTIFYAGYGGDSPVWSLQVQQGKHWKAMGPDWCGTGMGVQHLPPGDEVAFTELILEDYSTWRVGIDYKLDSKPEATMDRTVWSKPVTHAVLNGYRPSADKLVQLDARQEARKEFPYIFTVTNVSNKTLYYGGYREREIPPIYINEEKRHGRWEDHGHADWNGEGSSNFGFQRLSPGKSKTFSIPAQADVTWRIGLILFPTDKPRNYEDAYLPVRWPPQQPSK